MKNKIKHIIHITPVYWDNWEYQENVITEYQAKTGNKITVITPATSLTSYRKDLDGTTSVYYIKNVKIIRLKLKWNLFNRFYWYENLYNKLIQEAPDIIMVHGLAMIPMLEIIKFKKMFPNCNIYADFHSDYLNSGKNIFSKIFLHRLIWRYFIQKAIPYIEKIYYVRPSVKDFITDLYGVKDEILEELLMGSASRCFSIKEREIIKNNIRANLKIPKDSFVICTGGKIDKGKNIDILINSILELKDLQIHLIIFGKVDKIYLDSFKALIKDVENVHFIGWLIGNDVYDYFIASDIAIFLGLHSVLWEQAIGCGTPTMFCYRKDREYLNFGGNCLYLFRNNTPELSQYLKLLVNNSALILSMREIAITKGELKFSYQNIVSKLNKSWGLISQEKIV